MLAAIRNHIPNPLSLYGAGPATTFPTRYEPIWERTMGGYPQRPECRFVGNKFD
jgi:hypothetical protein